MRKIIGFDAAEMSDAELTDMADFLASQVDSMDDETVAYASYTGQSIVGAKQPVIKTLLPKLLLSYRKRLVEWFEFALVKRANIGGGGRLIGPGLARFVEEIPNAVISGHNLQIADFIPADNDYLNPERVQPVAEKIQNVVRSEATKAGVLGRPGRRASVTKEAAKMPFKVVEDEGSRIWYIPAEMKTFSYKDQLGYKGYGFHWEPANRRWEISALTPAIRSDFTIAELPPLASGDQVSAWYTNTWLPANIDRFSKVFTEFARNKESSYKYFFSVSSTGRVTVKLDRDITSAMEAVEELRYRYIGREGREPWLEVLDMFIELVRTTSVAKLPLIIDRINNLQHSNGLFMEHFPKSVQSWYEGFLNAKYSTPRADELAKSIPDKDVRELLIELARSGFRTKDWKYSPPPAYQHMKKELIEIGEKVNWRAKGYPRYKDERGVQVSRFDPQVQNGLGALLRLHKQRESFLNTEVQDADQYAKWKGTVEDWIQDYEKTRQDTERAMQEQQKKEREEPGAADAWDAANFPSEFIDQYPWAVPGVSKSEYSEFISKYATLSPLSVWDMKDALSE